MKNNLKSFIYYLNPSDITSSLVYGHKVKTSRGKCSLRHSQLSYTSEHATHANSHYI